MKRRRHSASASGEGHNRRCRSTAVDLLDEVNILATEPVPDTELMKGLVEGFLHRWEAEIGKKKGTAAGEQEQG